MSETCPTVKIKSTHPESQGPFVEINESDFDAKKHQRYEEPKKAAPVKPPGASAPTP